MTTPAERAPDGPFSRIPPWAGRTLLIVLTALSFWLTTTRLHISTDLSLLFPGQRESAALGRFSRVFGGGDGCVILVRAPSAEEARGATRAMAAAMRTKGSIERVLEQSPDLSLSLLDPTLAWLYAGPTAREALAHALSPEGMRERLSGTRTLLLAPGSSDAETWLAKDPLRLAMLPWEAKRELAAGVVASADGAFEADGGKAQLIVVQPKGSAFHSESAAAFMDDFDAAKTTVQAVYTTATVEVTGGHAISRATEMMFKVDLALSSTLSLVFASLMFVVTFRRARALAAVLPPLVVGTLWTTGLAAFLPHGLTGVAVAFTAVVVGVGVDTGVHVYAALLEGRRRGLAPRDAARFARRSTWRPTLLAAVAAGLAFGSLGLSSLEALQQLGVLCGVGEFLTAVAILWMTPEIGAFLERGEPPALRPARWTSRLLALTGTRKRAAWAFALASGVILFVALGGWPKTGGAIVAIRPRIAPLAIQETIYELFGGRPGQWIVIAEDATEERAEARADAVAEALDPLVKNGTIDGFDALAGYAPAQATQGVRLSERDRLNLPARRKDLEAALGAAGFDVAACAAGLDALSSPTTRSFAISKDRSSPVGWLVSRHLRAEDETKGGQAMAVTYVRPTGDAAKDAIALAAIAKADPETVVTGYPYLEVALRESLAHDLPKIALLACIVVAIALRTMLGRMVDVLIALSTIVVELAAVAVLMKVCHVSWHVYDALVLPVLVGVTIDESMFLLHAARQAEKDGKTGDAVILGALVEQGPLVIATALTTTAGFAALLFCKFDGLFDLGAVGVLGVLLGLVAALVIVPAGLRLAGVAQLAPPPERR